MKPLLSASLLLFAVLDCSPPVHAQTAPIKGKGVDAGKAMVKEIVAVFEEIEGNYQSWPHISYSAENLDDGHAYETHVWTAGDDSGFIRVESVNLSDHGEIKTQYFIRGDELVFVLYRTETTPMMPKASTQVTEKRLYFSGTKLVRLLTKEGQFAPGKPTETAGLTNKVVPPEEEGDPTEIYAEHTNAVAAIMAKAATLEDENAEPGAEAEADTAGKDGAEPGMTAAANTARISGKGWRLIKGSRCHDDKLGLAWGVRKQAAPTEEPDEDGDYSVSQDTEGLVNYVVNLKTGAILGETGGSHWGDKPYLNHTDHSCAWSSGDIFGVQVCSGRWATNEAVIFQVLDDTSISKTTDVLAAATAAAKKKLKGSAQFKAFGADGFAVTVYGVRFVQRGYEEVLEVGLNGQIPKSDEDHSSYDCTVTFRVEGGEGGVAPGLTWVSTEVQEEEAGN